MTIRIVCYGTYFNVCNFIKKKKMLVNGVRNSWYTNNLK